MISLFFRQALLNFSSIARNQGSGVARFLFFRQALLILSSSFAYSFVKLCLFFRQALLILSSSFA